MKFRNGRKYFSAIGFAIGFFVGIVFFGGFSTEPNAPPGFALFVGVATGVIFLVPAFLLGWFKDYVDGDAWRVNEYNKKISTERK